MRYEVSQTMKLGQLDKRYFFLFLVFQAIVFTGSLFYTEWLPVFVIGSVIAVLFVIGVLVRYTIRSYQSENQTDNALPTGQD